MGFLDKLFGKKQEVSPGGSAIYRYAPPEQKGFQPPETSNLYMAEIEAHFEKIFPGRGSFVNHELISELVHIDLHIMRPTPQADYYVVYTTGMSDLPMTLPDVIPPETRKNLERLELYMLLPSNWNVGDGQLTNRDMPSSSYWPLGLMKFLARFPHQFHTWLGWGHTIPNGPDYALLDDSVGFGGAVLSTLSVVGPLETKDGSRINFCLLIPAYKEEIEYKLKYGMEELDKRYSAQKLPVVLDPSRPNYCADFKEVLDS